MVLRITPPTTRPTTIRFTEGDRVVLTRPPESVQHELPGYHPWLDRHVGQPLTVKAAAQGDGYTLVLVYETIVPVRGDWLRLL